VTIFCQTICIYISKLESISSFATVECPSLICNCMRILTPLRVCSRQGRPGTAQVVVRRACARKVPPGEPAQSMVPVTRRRRVSPAAATARSLRQRRYALIRVHIHPLLYRYQTLVSESRLFFLELSNHQKFHTTVSGQHPVAPQPQRPTIYQTRFRTQCAARTNAWRCMVRKRRGTGEVMTMRCSSDEERASKMTHATCSARAGRSETLLAGALWRAAAMVCPNTLVRRC